MKESKPKKIKYKKKIYFSNLNFFFFLLSYFLFCQTNISLKDFYRTLFNKILKISKDI